MKLIYLACAASMICNSVLAMHNVSLSNLCGTIGKQINQDGSVQYNRITMGGIKTVVTCQEREGVKYFAGHKDDTFGRRRSANLSNDKATKKWHKLCNACEELIKINEDAKKYAQN